MDLADNDLTGEQWAAVKDAWKGCAYCGATDGPLQRDCVMAISRGGRYTVDNVVPPALPATRANAMTRSPAGCVESGSMSAYS